MALLGSLIGLGIFFLAAGLWNLRLVKAKLGKGVNRRHFIFYVVICSGIYIGIGLLALMDGVRRFQTIG